MKTRSGKKVKTKRPVRKTKTRDSSSLPNLGGVLGRFFLPLMICVCLATCLGALGYLGYQSVAASDFFDVQKVQVVGVERASGKNIETLVKTEAQRTGVWRADLLELKAKIERVPFVKSAAVTRVLPGEIRVQIDERQPQAIVRRGGHDQLVDADGEILALAERSEGSLPFVMVGWDESKTEKSWKDNIERVKIYQKMVNEWRISNLLSRVESINLGDLRDPRAIVADSGTTVSIAVGRDNFGENLMKGVKAVVGKGDLFDAVNLIGANLILSPRKQN